MMLLVVMNGCAARPSPGAPVEVEIPAAAPATTTVAGPTASAAPAASMIGRWEGVGHQSDASSWPLVVDLERVDEGVCARVAYPSIPCAGEWICGGGFDGRELRATERVTDGREACIDGGEMRMSLTSAGLLEWSWTGGGEKATALLRRTGPPRPP